MSPIGDDQLAPVTPIPKRRKAQAKKTASTKKHTRTGKAASASAGCLHDEAQQGQQGITPAPASQHTKTSNTASPGHQQGQGDLSSLVLQSLSLAKTSGPKPRAELTAHVLPPSGTRTRIHVLTLYQASWGEKFFTDASRIKVQAARQGLSKQQALRLRDEMLRPSAESDIE